MRLGSRASSSICAALAAAATLATACAPDEDELCAAVDRVVEVQAGFPRPVAVEIAERYRSLAAGYRAVAEALDDESAAASTNELAASYEAGAAVLQDHPDAGREQLDRLFEESEVLVALEERIEAGEALGFSRSAWDEIDGRCDVPVDPPASP